MGSDIFCFINEGRLVKVDDGVKPMKNLIFLKNGKNSKNCRNGSGKPENFSRSRMTKRTSSLDSSHEI